MMLSVPPEDIPIEVWITNLRQLAGRNLPQARQQALLRLLWHESYFTRAGLVARIEAILGFGCFGASSRRAFFQDMAVVRQNLLAAGLHLRYSRRADRPGYYIEGRPILDERIRRLIAGSVAEVDPTQMAITRQLTPRQRIQQGLSMVRLAKQVITYRRQYREVAVLQQPPQRIIRERLALEMTGPTMGFEEFMRLVLDALEAAEVEYMIGGAIAVWAWGEARTTRDFDLVVNIPFENIPCLSEELEKRDMLVPVEVILDLLTKPEGDLPINAIHLYTGYKAELFLLRPDDEFRATALARRRLADFGPPIGEVYVHAPEDLILYKILYFSLSHQPKHTRDIASIWAALVDELDVAYIETWAKRLGLVAEWQEILKKLQPKG